MATPGTFAIYTLGCKLNFSESSAVSRQLEKAGWTAINTDESADLYVINTCSVTEFADKKCRQTVRKFLRANPNAKIIVTGCYAQLQPEQIAEIEGVDLVLGAAEKFQLAHYAEQLIMGVQKEMIASNSISEHRTFEPAVSFGDRTRAFLKVQDGCDYKCTFCTIPRARGKSRSAAIESIVQQVNDLVENEIKEVVLTGVNIGDFGKGEFASEKKKFIDLIRALDEIKAIDRFRISSIEPNLCDDEIIDFVAKSNRFMPHFHMPLQSGNNKQLRGMRRRYTRELYQDRVRKIKQLMPHACIGVDVIVGFPGETAEDFEETYKFLHDLDISYLHVFTFSQRPDTLAFDLEEQVDMNVRRKRNERLRMLSAKKKHHFYTQHLDTSRTVLFEQEQNNGQITGFTDNYIKVETLSNPSLFNELKLVELNGEINAKTLVLENENLISDIENKAHLEKSIVTV